MGHRQLHSIDDTSNHTGVSGTEDNLVSLDTNGLPQDSGSALTDIDMQLAYDNDAAILFSKNMSWDLNEAYDFILQEGTDNVTIQALTANSIHFGALVNSFDIDAAQGVSIDAADGGTIEVGGGSFTAGINIGTKGTRPTITVGQSDSVALLNLRGANISLDSFAASAINQYIALDCHNTGAGEGRVDIDATNEINIGTASSRTPIITIGRPTAGIELRLVDENHVGSSWTQAYIPLSDAQADWDTFETNFGEVSLMTAINAAYSGSVLTMQGAYDNGAGITFDKNMSWDLAEAYDFILEEGTDNVTVEATAANAITFSAEAEVIDFNSATTLDLTASRSVTGTATVATIAATNTGAAIGDNATVAIYSNVSFPGNSFLYLGRNAAGDTFTANTYLDAAAAIRIGTTAACEIALGKSESASTIWFTDRYHAAASPAWTAGGIYFSGAGTDWDNYKSNFGEVSLLSAVNSAYTGSTLWTTSGATNLIPAAAGRGLDIDATGTSTVELNAAAASHFTVAGAGLTLSTTTSGDIDISAAANLDLDGATVNINSTGTLAIGDDVATINFDGSGAVTETGITNYTITPSGTLTMQGGGVSKYGDDVATWDFDGSGAVSETGMTSLSATPSGAITLTAGATSTWSTSAGDLNVSAAADLDLDGATVNINSTGTLKIGDDVATLDFDGSGAVTETGMTSFTISPSGAIALTSADNSNLTLAATDAADKTLTLAASNAGAGDGIVNIQGDTVNIGNSGATVIDAQSNKITNMDPGTENTDAVNLAQLNNAVNGLSWQSPATVLKIKSDVDQSGADPTAGSTGEAWLVNNWLNETDGNIVEWDGAAWQVIVTNSGGEPPDGTRVVVIDAAAAGSFVGEEDNIGVYDATGNSWSFTTAANGMAVLIDGDGGVYENTGWTYDDTPGEWVQFSGANLYTAGNGISISSQVISLTTLTADWAAGGGTYDITGLAILETAELKLGVVAQAAQPTPTSGTATIWRDTDDSNAIYIVFNDPTTGVVAVELT